MRTHTDALWRPEYGEFIGRRLREGGHILAVALLAGILNGLGIALANLSAFSHLPGFSEFVIALVAGGYIGLLSRRLSQSLIVFLLTILIAAGVGTLALSYAELEVRRLGLELAVEISSLQGLEGGIFTTPVVLIGLLLGKFIARGD